jgi:hypothetical protein
MRPNIIAFAIGALGPMAMVIVAWVWKIGSELVQQTPEERAGGGSWFLATFGLVSLLITALPFFVITGLVAVLVRYAGLWLRHHL